MLFLVHGLGTTNVGIWPTKGFVVGCKLAFSVLKVSFDLFFISYGGFWTGFLAIGQVDKQVRVF